MPGSQQFETTWQAVKTTSLKKTSPTLLMSPPPLGRYESTYHLAQNASYCLANLSPEATFAGQGISRPNVRP